MSLPPAAVLPMGSMSVPALLNPIEYFIMNLNTNPYFIGLMMLLLNLGGRFIGMEVSKEQEKVLQQPWIRRALIFTVLFVATRNVLVALIMTIFVLLTVSFLFNENTKSKLLKTKLELFEIDALYFMIIRVSSFPTSLKCLYIIHHLFNNLMVIFIISFSTIITYFSTAFNSFLYSF